MDPDVEVVGRGRVVVTAFPLPDAARERLEQLLPGSTVVDIRRTVVEADLVLAPSCSPRTIAALKRAFPTALIVVAELEDDELGVDLPGPVKRLFRAGIDGYITADSLADLAEQLAPGSAGNDPDTANATVHELGEQTVDGVVMRSLTEQLRLRETAHRDERG